MKFNRNHVLIAIIFFVLFCTVAEGMMTQDEKMKAFHRASRDSVDRYLKHKKETGIANFQKASRISEADFKINQLKSPPVYPTMPATIYTPVRLNDGRVALQAPRDIRSDSGMTTDEYLRMFF